MLKMLEVRGQILRGAKRVRVYHARFDPEWPAHAAEPLR